MAPTPMSVRCIDPPLPPQRPSALPRISPNVRSSGAPIARTAPWPRYVQLIVSPRPQRARRADHDGLLAVAQMRRAAHEALREQAVALALEVPDLVHGAQPFQTVVERNGELDRRGRGVLGHARDDITLFATLFRI